MIMDKALEYFTTFSEKDSEGLRSMFANNITLSLVNFVFNMSYH